ncbi:nucleolin isoform X2 [Phalaenopsis equestris]|uniref:nucleolin isoform X2 n=1 Tax=Phalaenopsis equestris TaxID=78828 RepID=UPI0009E4292C|nr:nucleolin isoform X2 [Phalaenopsis equestris]
MPPRVVKKATGPGRKGAARATKTAAKDLQNQADATENAVDAKKVELNKEAPAEEIVEVKPDKKQVEVVKAANGSVAREVLKDISEEEDKGERLELDDNEPEYEEEATVDYDERMIDDDVQEVDEGEEEVEEADALEEEEGDMVVEEIEDGGEDVEDEEDHENVEEEHEVDGEEEEHHDIVKERRKRKEFEVFVGGLDKDATEDDLRKVFDEVGEITEIRLLMNPHTKKNKGFAFLRFATVEQAKRAVTELKNPVINGKQCGVAQSQDSDTLFLGNICKTWTKEHLKEKLKSFGINNIEDLMLVEDASNDGMNRGFAFLEFSSRSDAMDAYRRLQKRDVVLGVDRSAKVAFADSFIEPDDEIMSQVKTVFLDGIPPAWDEERVKEHVKKFGKIEKVELARNMPAAKRKDFGFVTFDLHEAAVSCAEGINNVELGEGDNKVKVRARLSRPLQRGRGKRVSRGDFRISHVPRASWSNSTARRLPLRASRGSIGRGAPVSVRGASIGGRGPKRTIGLRDRRAVPAFSERARHLPPPERSYGRRPPIPVYPKSHLSKRDYDRRDELTHRSRNIAEYGPRIPTDRRSSYEDDYSRGGGYSDIPPRTLPRSAERRSYVDEGYGRKLERTLPSYREGRSRDYDSISGSKRPYSALDDTHPRYADVSMRQSRARLDYGSSGGSAQYEDSYGERLGRSHIGYGNSRSSISGRDSHGLYGGRHGMGYSSDSVGGSDVDGLYSSSNYGSSYLSRGSDVGGGSYSSMYSGRSLSGSGYLRGSGSGSYY